MATDNKVTPQEAAKRFDGGQVNGVNRLDGEALAPVETAEDRSRAAAEKARKAEEPKQVHRKAHAYVKAVNGNITHLFTGVVIDQKPQKLELDDYLQAQIDAGKVETVSP